jgi:hypothetical protein
MLECNDIETGHPTKKCKSKKPATTNSESNVEIQSRKPC